MGGRKKKALTLSGIFWLFSQGKGIFVSEKLENFEN